MSEVVNIERWLNSLGFESPYALFQARSILEALDLTRPGKRGMAAEKLPRAASALHDSVLRSCGDTLCLALAGKRAGGRLVATVRADQCEICLGSDNRRAALAMADAMADAGRHRLLVVGGTGGNHADLAELLVGTGVELRCVDGAERSRTKKAALPDLAWADLMVVWASTPLPHKVSVSYTDERPPELPMITVARRGIAALCNEVRASVADPRVGRTRRR